VKSGLGPAQSPQYLFFTVYDQCHNSVIKTLTVTIINEVRINVYMSSKYKPENSCVCNINTCGDKRVDKVFCRSEPHLSNNLKQDHVSKILVFKTTCEPTRQ